MMKTQRFRVRLAGFMNLKNFSLEIKWPILMQKRRVFVIVLMNLKARVLTTVLYGFAFLLFSDKILREKIGRFGGNQTGIVEV